MFSGIVLVYWLIDAESPVHAATRADMQRIRQDIEANLVDLHPRFSFEEGAIGLTPHGSWKTAGKRIIIRALERIVEQEEAVQSQASALQDTSPS